MFTRIFLSLIALAAAVLASDPVSLRGPADRGTFFVYVNEERLVIINFEWTADGRYHGESSVSLAGQTAKSKVDIKVDAEGRWTAMELETPLGPMSLKREGDVSTRVFKEKTTTTNLKPDSIMFENMSPALLAQAVRHYDAAQGGKQKFPLFLVPGAMLEASVEKKDVVERAVGGRDMRLSRYVVGLPGVDVTVYAEADGRVDFVDVPAQKAAYVREGFEVLRKSVGVDPKLSAPSFDVKTESLKVPMRDGIALAADLYRPVTDAKVPIILIRTPYKKEMNELDGRFYARRGYAVVIEDCRGRFASPGVWEPFVNEAKDGYDTIEHLAKLPWSSGKVGMIGASYLGWVQWWAASQKPPHLATIIPNVAPPDPFYNVPYEYGAFFLTGAIWWADVLESNATADITGGALSKIGEKKYAQRLRALPVIDLDKDLLGKENPYWRKWIQHPVNDSYWAPANFLDKLKGLDIPVFHQSGWFDGDGIGSKLNYAAMTAGGSKNQKLVLGPWGHQDKASRRLGDHDFGESALLDLQTLYLRWFDHYLKGVDNGIEKEPLVNVFVMGSDKWLTAETYPLPQTKFTKWFLGDGGKLTRDEVRGTPMKYTYDPGDPTPDWRMFDDPEADSQKVRASEEIKKRAEEYEKKVLAERKDILVFLTDPFEQPYTFAGPVSATLYASSTAKDTDFFVRLVEVDAEGKSFALGLGKVRARFRNTTHKEEFLKPGEIYEYKFDLWQTGITVKKGHRLRIEIASADFPFFSRNLNTGGHNETETKFVPATQTIYRDAKHPSHLLLPEIP